MTTVASVPITTYPMNSREELARMAYGIAVRSPEYAAPSSFPVPLAPPGPLSPPVPPSFSVEPVPSTMPELGRAGD